MTRSQVRTILVGAAVFFVCTFLQVQRAVILAGGSGGPSDRVGGGSAKLDDTLPASLGRGGGDGTGGGSINNAPLVLSLLDHDRRAVCLDSSPGGFYVARAPVPSDTWVIFLEGGGLCFSEQDCAHRAYEEPDSFGSNAWAPSLTLSGDGPATLASGDCAANPALCRANRVYVKACDGTAFSGNRGGGDNDAAAQQQPAKSPGSSKRSGTLPTPRKSEKQLRFRGSRVLRASVKMLVDRWGLADARRVVLAGAETGGSAALLHAETVRRMIREAKAAAAIAAGAGAPATGEEDGWSFAVVSDGGAVAGAGEGAEGYDVQVRYLAAMANATGSLNPACEAKNGWACMKPLVSYRHTSAPVFLLDSAFDGRHAACLGPFSGGGSGGPAGFPNTLPHENLPLWQRRCAPAPALVPCAADPCGCAAPSDPRSPAIGRHAAAQVAALVGASEERAAEAAAAASAAREGGAGSAAAAPTAQPADGLFVHASPDGASGFAAEVDGVRGGEAVAAWLGSVWDAEAAAAAAASAQQRVWVVEVADGGGCSRQALEGLPAVFVAVLVLALALMGACVWGAARLPRDGDGDDEDPAHYSGDPYEWAGQDDTQAGDLPSQLPASPHFESGTGESPRAENRRLEYSIAASAPIFSLLRRDDDDDAAAPAAGSPLWNARVSLPPALRRKGSLSLPQRSYSGGSSLAG